MSKVIPILVRKVADATSIEWDDCPNMQSSIIHYYTSRATDKAGIPNFVQSVGRLLVSSTLKHITESLQLGWWGQEADHCWPHITFNVQV